MGKKGEYEGWKLKEKFALVYSAESAKMRLQEEPMIAKRDKKHEKTCGRCENIHHNFADSASRIFRR